MAKVTELEARIKELEGRVKPAALHRELTSAIQGENTRNRVVAMNVAFRVCHWPVHFSAFSTVKECLYRTLSARWTHIL